MTPELRIALQVILAILAMTMVVAFYRVVRGPSAPDRIVALDLVAGVLVGNIGVYCVLTSETQLLRVAMGLALLSFLGTATVARYLEKSATREEER